MDGGVNWTEMTILQKYLNVKGMQDLHDPKITFHMTLIYKQLANCNHLVCDA